MLARLHSLLGLWLAALLCLHVYWLWPLLDDRDAWVLASVQRSVSRPLVVALVLLPLLGHFAVGIARARRRRDAEPGGERGLLWLQAVTGALVVAFLAHHLAQVWSQGLGPHAGPRDGYAVLFRDLGRPWDLGVYLVGVSAACFHAGHGLARAASTWRLVRTPRGVLVARLISGAAAFVLWGCSLQLLGHFVLGQRLVP
jgi:hypothetical protein